jgi:hypothetical protein
MRKINAKVALITGPPLAILIAFFEDNLREGSSWLILGRQALLCAAILGVPQGYLAARPVWRRGWAGLPLLLPAMMITGLALTNLAVIADPFLLSVLPGGWVHLPNPPARAIALIGLNCTDGYPFPTTVWVETADRSIYRFDEPAEWTPVKGAPTIDRGFCSASAPNGLAPRTRLVTHQGLGPCGQDLEVVLGDDGQISRRAFRGGCARGDRDLKRIIVFFLSVVLSSVAWMTVVFQPASFQSSPARSRQ